MTQQVDPKSSATAHPSHGEPVFVFESHTGGRSGGGAGATTGSLADRWPLLDNIRQVLSAFVLEAVATSRPYREKANVVGVRAWNKYLGYIQTYPLMTIFLSSLVFLCSGPVIVFACITGVSLGILLGTAAVVVIVIQSIIVSIAGAILLFVLGSILILTAFAFFWVVVGYLGFSFMRNFALVLHAQHQHLRQQQPHSSSAHMRRDSTKSMEDDDFTL